MVEVDYKKELGYAMYQPKGSDETYKITMHPMNGLFAFIYHYEENDKKYAQLIWFADNMEHLKNMLGFSKWYKDNIMKDEFKEIHFNLDFEKEWKGIPELLVKARMNVGFYKGV